MPRKLSSEKRQQFLDSALKLCVANGVKNTSTAVGAIVVFGVGLACGRFTSPSPELRVEPGPYHPDAGASTGAGDEGPGDHPGLALGVCSMQSARGQADAHHGCTALTPGRAPAARARSTTAGWSPQCAPTDGWSPRPRPPSPSGAASSPAPIREVSTVLIQKVAPGPRTVRSGLPEVRPRRSAGGTSSCRDAHPTSGPGPRPG